MGYYTSYSLTYEAHNEDTVKRFKDFYYREENEMFQYAIDVNGDTRDTTKWYEWEADMLRLSRAMPDVFFTLHGEGEEPGDIWNAYLLDGKIQWSPAQVVIPPFDKDLLRYSREESWQAQVKKGAKTYFHH